MPKAIRVGLGVVKTELAIASDGPAAIPSASSCSVLPLLDGKSASSGIGGLLHRAADAVLVGDVLDGVARRRLVLVAATAGGDEEGEQQ